MEKSRFHFYISGEEKEIFPGSRLWELPLSGGSTGRGENSRPEAVSQDKTITVGEYLSTACRALSQKDFSLLQAGLGAIFSKPVSMDDSIGVSVFLKNTGPFITL
nr:hypothetical protein [Desulfobacula sp.]